LLFDIPACSYLFSLATLDYQTGQGADLRTIE